MAIKHFYLITNYNLQQYLSDAFNSIVAQYSDLDIFYSNAIVLISDDCSFDASAEALIQKIRLQHKNVKYWIQVENLGVGANKSFLLEQARDMGLRRQDLVTFLDADDMLAQDCMSMRLEALEQDLTLDAVGGQLLLIADDSSSCVVDTFYTDSDFAKIANLFECQLYGSNCTFRGEVFLPNKNFPDVAFNDDWMFCALNNIEFRHIPQVTLNYRRHAMNNTNAPVAGAQYEHRKFTRNLQLVQMGVILTDAENKLLDIVGFLVFKQEFNKNGVNYRPDVHMPWFSTIPRGDSLRNLQIAFEELKGKLISKNDIHVVYSSSKLRIFLNAIATQLHRI